MFPTFVQTVPGARRPAPRFSPLWGSACVALLLSACLSSPDGKSRKKDSGEGVSVAVGIHPAALAKSAAEAAAPSFDSVHIRITAPDMDALDHSFDGTSENVTITDLPAGEDRRFEAFLFQEGRLLYSGESTVDLHTDQNNSVSLLCLPEFSRISASVHIPIDFPKVVAGGELKLWGEGDTLSATPIVNGELRVFRLEEVPGDRDYDLSIVLWDEAGDTLAWADRADLHVPKGENVALMLPLNITFSELQIVMTVEDPRTTSLVMSFPAGVRVPAGFGEAVFSELYPVPAEEDGDDAAGEWLELFNRVADSLDVSGCRVTRDAATSSAMILTLPDGTVIPPGRGLVAGRSGVDFADVPIGSSALSLTNSNARLELSCEAGEVLLDTLHYSTAASDSLAARIEEGSVSALRPSRIAARHDAGAWCLVSPSPAAGAATPGVLDGSCGE